MDRKFIVAIEIASSHISATAASVNENKNVTILCYHKASATDCIRYGNVVNVEKTNQHVSTLIQAIEKDDKINPRKVTKVFVGIDCRSLHNEVANFSKDLSVDTPIQESDIKTLEREAAEKYSDFKVLGTYPRSFEIDQTEHSNPIGIVGAHLSASYNVIVCRQQIIRNIGMVFNSLGMDIKLKDIIVTPLAVAKIVLTPEERRLGCMLVDHGAETTTVSIYKNDRLMYLNVLPMGSKNITRDLTSLNILEENAERLKRDYGNAIASSDDAPKFNVGNINPLDFSNLVTARAGEIAENIAYQLQIAGFDAETLPAGIVAIGGGCELKGFLELLSQATKMNVRKGFLPGNQNDASLNQKLQILSIADVAANILGNDSCLTEIEEKKELPPLPQIDEYEQPEEEEEEEEKKKKKPAKSSGKGFWTKVREKLATIANDDRIFEEDEEENDNSPKNRRL